MYLNDVCTIPSNLAGNPAMSVPFGIGDDGLPVGVQVLAPALGEATMFRAAAVLEGSGRERMSIADGWEMVVGLEVHGELATRDEAVLRLPQPLRRRAQHQHLPGLPRPARLAAGAQPAGRRAGDHARPGAALPRRAVGLRPEELLLSGHAEGLPDQPVRPADQRRRLPRPARRAPAIGIERAHIEEDTGKSTHLGDGGSHPRRRRTRSSTTTAPACRWSRSCAGPTSAAATRPRPTSPSCAPSSSPPA